MLEFDTTITITVAVALAAIISPILVAIINNTHQTKIRKIELEHERDNKIIDIYYEDKKQAYITFLNVAGNYPDFQDEKGLGFSRLHETASTAILFSTQITGDSINQFFFDAKELRKKGISESENEYRQKLCKLTEILTVELCRYRKDI